jgi:hypothetical protein
LKRYRRNAEYASDSRAFRPIDRNERVRVIIAAEALERRTKGKGNKSGVLRQSGLRVLRSLLFDFCAVPTGRCCPSYEALRERTGFCFATIAGALQRLELSGLVTIVRRLIRTTVGARQTSNAYAFSEFAQGLKKPDFRNSRETANLIKTNSIQEPISGLLPVPLNHSLSLALRSLGRSIGFTNTELQARLHRRTEGF